MKKIVCILMCIIMSMQICTYAQGYSIPCLPYLSGERVSLIVEVEGAPVLECTDSQNISAYSFSKSRTAKLRREEILSVQSEVNESILQTVPDIEKGFTYTNVFNGFSVTANRSDINKILEVNNVKNVYVSEQIPVYEPQLTAAEEEINIEYASDTCGYNGEGQVICIIDNEFDINHDMFKEEPQNPKFSKENVSEFVKGMASVNQAQYGNVYKTPKIPFAYDYYDNDTDTYCDNEDANHGTHVASIAAGKGGKKSDSTVFNGIAPEAQLVLMKVGDGKSFGMDKVLAALDDACILDIDAINMSLGKKYIHEQDVYTKAIEVARNSGISVCVSGGNAGKGYEGKIPYTDSVEYFSGGAPGNSKGAFTVSASNGNSVASFSSYCTTGSLELEPDITAPGYKIYAAKKGNEYQLISGTSMASPCMAGISVIMNQFAEDKFPDVSDKIQLIENLLMSSAKILKQSNGVPYSPRVQGAGKADVRAAMKTPAVLKGTYNESKISLYDKLTDEFELTFNVQNLSDKAVTYDSIAVSTLTDGYVKSDDRYKVGNTIRLNSTAQKPESITVPAFSKVPITVKVKLDSSQTLQLKKIFTNGFYVEGFVTLADSSLKNPEISIPFMGFYGDWLKAEFFDEPKGKENAISDLFGILSNKGNELFFAGQNIYNESIFDSDYAVISPNNDGYNDIMGLSLATLRSLGEVNMYVVDEKGVQKSGIWVADNPQRLSMSAYDLCDMIKYLKDGSYKLCLTGKHIYDSKGNALQTTYLPFCVDRQAPGILRTRITEDNGKKLWQVAATDNHHLSALTVSGYSGYTQKTAGVSLNPAVHEDKNGIVYATVDITGIDTDNANVKAADFGNNISGMILSDYHKGLGVIVNSDLSVKISGKFENTSNAPINTKAVFAFYDGDDVLLGASVKDFYIPKGVSEYFADLPDNITGTEKVKVFFWDENMTPLRENADFYMKVN